MLVANIKIQKPLKHQRRLRLPLPERWVVGVGLAAPNQKRMPIKMVLAATLLMHACNKRVVPGRYKKAGRYLLNICYVL